MLAVAVEWCSSLIHGWNAWWLPLCFLWQSDSFYRVNILSAPSGDEWHFEPCFSGSITPCLDSASSERCKTPCVIPLNTPPPATASVVMRWRFDVKPLCTLTRWSLPECISLEPCVLLGILPYAKWTQVYSEHRCSYYLHPVHEQ